MDSTKLNINYSLVKYLCKKYWNKYIKSMGETFISATYKKEDVINLDLTMTSSEEAWDKAIDIFEDRIKGRYLDVIDK